MTPDKLSVLTSQEIRSDGLDDNYYVNAHTAGKVITHLMEEIWYLKDFCPEQVHKDQYIKMVKDWKVKLKELERC